MNGVRLAKENICKSTKPEETVAKRFFEVVT